MKKITLEEMVSMHRQCEISRGDCDTCRLGKSFGFTFGDTGEISIELCELLWKIEEELEKPDAP